MLFCFDFLPEDNEVEKTNNFFNVTKSLSKLIQNLLYCSIIAAIIFKEFILKFIEVAKVLLTVWEVSLGKTLVTVRCASKDSNFIHAVLIIFSFLFYKVSQKVEQRQKQKTVLEYTFVTSVNCTVSERSITLILR